jgi:hypothetical protein
MDDPVKLEVHRGRKKEKCRFCSHEAHEEPLACPRIRSITLNDEGGVHSIRFWEWWGSDDEPDLAG